MYELTMETLQHSTWQLGPYPVWLCVHDLSNRPGWEAREKKVVETPHIRAMNTPEHGEKGRREAASAATASRRFVTSSRCISEQPMQVTCPVAPSHDLLVQQSVNAMAARARVADKKT